MHITPGPGQTIGVEVLVACLPLDGDSGRGGAGDLTLITQGRRACPIVQFHKEWIGSDVVQAHRHRCACDCGGRVAILAQSQPHLMPTVLTAGVPHIERLTRLTIFGLPIVGQRNPAIGIRLIGRPAKDATERALVGLPSRMGDDRRPPTNRPNPFEAIFVLGYIDTIWPRDIATQANPVAKGFVKGRRGG